MIFIIFRESCIQGPDGGCFALSVYKLTKRAPIPVCTLRMSSIGEGE